MAGRRSVGLAAPARFASLCPSSLLQAAQLLHSEARTLLERLRSLFAQQDKMNHGRNNAPVTLP